MKKTIVLIVVLLVSLIMLTGCVNVNYEIKVNRDGSGDISYIYAFSKESLNSLQVPAEDMVSSMKKQAEDNEYKTDTYEDDEYAGFKASKHIKDLENEFSLNEAFGDEYFEENKEENNGIKIKSNFLKTEISQNSEIDLTSMQDVASMVKMTYTVKLPVSVKSNNATEAKGKTLTWDLKGGEINKIEYTAVGINALPIVLIVVLIIAVIVICYILFFRKKTKSNVETK